MAGSDDIESGNQNCGNTSCREFKKSRELSVLYGMALIENKTLRLVFAAAEELYEISAGTRILSHARHAKIQQARLKMRDALDKVRQINTLALAAKAKEE